MLKLQPRNCHPLPLLLLEQLEVQSHTYQGQVPIPGVLLPSFRPFSNRPPHAAIIFIAAFLRCSEVKKTAQHIFSLADAFCLWSREVFFSGILRVGKTQLHYAALTVEIHPVYVKKCCSCKKKQPVDTICDCGISNKLQNVEPWLVSNPITDGLYQWKPFTSPRFSIHFPSFTRVHQQVSYGCKHSGSSCNSVAKFLATLGPPIGAPTQPARTWAWHDHGWVFDPFKGWCNAPGPGFPLLP